MKLFFFFNPLNISYSKCPLKIGLVLLFVLGLAQFKGFAQVGIGTPMPNASAQLEVVADNRGILIPQVALTSNTDTTTILNGNIESLLVFNTSTVGQLTPGYYYWMDNQWNRLTTTNDIANIGADNQTITAFGLVNDQLSISLEDGNTASIPLTDLANVLNTDSQQLERFEVNGGNLEIAIEGGNTRTIPLTDLAGSETLTLLSLNQDGIHLDYTDEANNVSQINLQAIISNLQTTTTLVDNNNGSFSYNNEAGATTTITGADLETPLAITTDGNNTGVALSGTNNHTAAIRLRSLDANNVLASGADGGLFLDANALPSAVVTQAAGNTDLETIVTPSAARTIATHDPDGAGGLPPTSINETVTILSDNSNGSFTFTNELSNMVTITGADLETPLAITTDGNNTGVALSGTNNHTAAITLRSLDANNALASGADGGLYLDTNAFRTSVITQAAGNTDLETIVTPSAARTIATHDPDGAGGLPPTTINETITFLTDNTNGSFSFTNELGNTTSFSAIALQPWYGTDDNDVATTNTEDIYHMGQIGIGTDNPSTNLEVDSGLPEESGLRLSQINQDTGPTHGARAIGVDTAGDVVTVARVELVFVGKVLPGSTIDPGFNYAALEPVYDPYNRYNATSKVWVPNSQGIYEVNISLHRIDGPMPFDIHRPNSATLKRLPTDTSQFFQYHYTGIKAPDNSVQGANNFGIMLRNSSGATYTFDPSFTYVNRGYWTITIKRLARQ